MKVTTIGIGNAGSKVVDSFLEMNEETGRDIISDAFVFTTAKSDLGVIKQVPKSKRILLTSHDTRASGTGNKPELGGELIEDNINVVKNALSSIPIHKTDALVVVASLGGGTGSGGAPVVSNKLREWFDIPVFGFGILPNERGHFEFNAARSFMDFGRTTDNLFLIDNAEYLGPRNPSGRTTNGSIGILHRSGGDTRLGGYDIPAGTKILLPQYTVHRDDRWFDEPATFRPERFRDAVPEDRPDFAYFPFGAGPHQCIGTHFAMLELQHAIPIIARHVEFDLLSSPDPEIKSELTLQPTEDVRVRVQK